MVALFDPWIVLTLACVYGSNSTQALLFILYNITKRFKTPHFFLSNVHNFESTWTEHAVEV